MSKTRTAMSRSQGWIIWMLLMIFLSPLAINPVFAEGQGENDQGRVMQSFERQEEGIKSPTAFSTEQKHRVMFYLGVPLLISLIIAGALGISMGVYGKQVYVFHMIFAGLGITLAIVHAIVGLVWFFPF